MKVAITGATGMIGISIVKQLLEKDDDIIAIVRPNSKRISNIPKSDRIEIIECAMSDYEKIFSDRKCDMFFHLAWDSTSGEKRDDVNIQLKNVENTISAVKLAKSWGAKVFVGAGSQAEYGPKDCALKGDTPVNPESGYGIAKYMAYKMSKILCDQLEIRFCWGRILSAYGENDGNHTLISYLIDTFLSKKVPDLTKCEQVWDYVYADDVASAFISIGLNGKHGKAYCIGSGKPRIMREYVEEVKSAIDSNLDVNYGAIQYYPHQPMYLCADIKELTDDTGFVPSYSFEEGIKRTISYRKNKK